MNKATYSGTRIGVSRSTPRSNAIAVGSQQRAATYNPPRCDAPMTRKGFATVEHGTKASKLNAWHGPGREAKQNTFRKD